MATNQVKDSKNSNAQYASSFDNEKVDAKTISEISKKADAGDALLFANKMKGNGSSDNGASGGRSNELSLFPNPDGGKVSSEGLKGTMTGNSGFVMSGTSSEGNKGMFSSSEGLKGTMTGNSGFVMSGIGSEGNKGAFSSNVGMSVFNPDMSSYKSVPENTAISRNNDYDVKNDENKQPGAMAYGNVILDTIAAQRTYVEPTEAASTIRDIGVQVANEILATREALNARQEVRIMLKDSVLKDTEVFVIKDGKSLSVSFVTGASESADILNQRSGDLRTQLMERLDDVDFVDIQVEDNSQSNADNQNQDGRSQNRFGNGDQSQDDDQ